MGFFVLLSLSSYRFSVDSQEIVGVKGTYESLLGS